jgi:hypothetical protein
MNTIDRIPYEHWINSQLNIVRFYGGIKINGKEYVVDPTTNDLVLVQPKPKKNDKKTTKKTTA